MNIILLLALIKALALGAAAAEWPVLTKGSTLKWTGTKVTGAHNGSVALKSGSVVVDGKKLAGGQFEIDMNSITVEDLQGGSKDKLTAHLKSADFFEVDKYPTAKFVIKKVSPLKNDKEGNTHTVSGELTMKGKTKPLSFPARISVGDKSAEAVAKVKVDRTKWDVRYGSGKFFKGLGDKMIHDEFTLDLDLKAAKK